MQFKKFTAGSKAYGLDDIPPELKEMSSKYNDEGKLLTRF